VAVKARAVLHAVVHHGRVARPFTIILIVVALGVGVDPLLAQGGQPSVTRIVQAATSTARHGAYYLPSNYDARVLPLMVGFHGTGGTGALMVRRLQTVAEREGFIVLAPDSVSVAGVWSVGQRSDEVTEDYRHVMDCVHEVMRSPGVRVDAARVLAVGFSVGASVAPYIATHESQFTDFAVLHGHITPASFGPLRPRAWVSAGDQDRVRTVEYMRSVADHLTRARFPSVELRVFKSDHRLGDEELAALVVWWLGKR